MEDDLLMELQAPGQDGSPMEVEEPLADLERFTYTGEDDLDEIVEAAPEEQPQLYLGKYTAEQMAQRIEQIEQKEEMDYYEVTPQDFQKYGVNPQAIPDNDRNALDVLLNKYLGVGLQQASTQLIRGQKAIEQVGKLRSASTMDKYEQELKQEWGENYNYIRPRVQADFDALTADEKAVYNRGTNGAKLLGTKYQLAILQGKVAATPQVPNAKTAPLLRTSVPSKNLSTGSKKYSLSAIEARAVADPQWYARNSKQIGQLHKKGLLDP